MSRARLLRTVAATLLVLLATAAPALAHTTVSPGEVEPDATVTLSFRAPPERNAVNESLRVLVPVQFAASECAGPQTWTCEFDTETHAPHTVVTYTAPEALPVIGSPVAGVLFELTVTAPSADDAGVYLFRALQGYSDGFTAPWVFEGDSYPAPTVKVGADDTVRNGAGSANEPCFGPAEPPAEGEEPDGTEQTPCPSSVEADADTADNDTTTDGAADDDSGTVGAAPSADGESAADAAAGDPQLASTGGGAAMLAISLFGAAATLRRRR